MELDRRFGSRKRGAVSNFYRGIRPMRFQSCALRCPLYELFTVGCHIGSNVSRVFSARGDVIQRFPHGRSTWIRSRHHASVCSNARRKLATNLWFASAVVATALACMLRANAAFAASPIMAGLLLASCSRIDYRKYLAISLLITPLLIFGSAAVSNSAFPSEEIRRRELSVHF